MPRKRMLLHFQYFSKVIYLKMLLLGHQKIAIHRALEILTEASIYNMGHIIWLIFYVIFYTIWAILYGSYHMEHIIWFIFYVLHVPIKARCHIESPMPQNITKMRYHSTLLGFG